MALLTPTEKAGFTQRIRTLRAQRRAEDDAAIDERLTGLIGAVKAERAQLKQERAAERRAAGEAWDQKVGDYLTSIAEAADLIVDEDALRGLYLRTVNDYATQVLQGQLTLVAALEISLDNLEEDYDDITDFENIPTVGWAIELYSDLFVGPRIRTVVRPWALKTLQSAIDALRGDDEE